MLGIIKTFNSPSFSFLCVKMSGMLNFKIKTFNYVVSDLHKVSRNLSRNYNKKILKSFTRKFQNFLIGGDLKKRRRFLMSFEAIFKEILMIACTRGGWKVFFDAIHLKRQLWPAIELKLAMLKIFFVEFYEFIEARDFNDVLLRRRAIS